MVNVNIYIRKEVNLAPDLELKLSQVAESNIIYLQGREDVVF
jgi:hypothetical protein